MNDGLKDKHRKTLIDLLAANPRVERVVLFGSRAMGTHSTESDIDLALYGDALTLDDLARLKERIEETTIPQQVDLVLVKDIDNEKLLEHIRKYEVEWFRRDDKRKVGRSNGVESEWRHSSWGDEISLEYGKRIRNYKEKKAPFCVYGSNGPVGWTEEPAIDGPGVILGRKGAYRGVEYSPYSFSVIDTAYWVRPRRNQDIRWLYYAIKHHKLGEIDDGSPIPSTTRSAVYVRELLVPPADEQRTIAHILGTLDDKIELNRKMNKTLEAMAQALFKSWFIDFDPVVVNALRAGNPVPEKFAQRAAHYRKLLHDPSPSGRGVGVRAKKKPQLPPDLLEFTRSLRKNQTDAEQLLWQLLRGRRFLGLKFRRQHPVKPYVLDFYSHELKLAVEVDGGQHNDPEQSQKDEQRTAFLAQQGITVVRYWADTVLKDTEAVLLDLYEKVRRMRTTTPSPLPPLPEGEGNLPFSEDFLRQFPDRFQDSELGPIPEGWSIKRIGDLLELAYGKALPTKSRKPGPYPVYGSGGIGGYHSECLVKGPGIIVGRKGTVGSVYWEDEDFFPIDTVFYVKTKKPVLLYWVYLMLSRMDIKGMGADSAVPGVNRNAVYAHEWILPTTPAIDLFRDFIQATINKLQENRKESDTLMSLRDTLLPKLISGELRVPDAEKLLEDAL